jgi:hypothetical protein
MSLLNFIHCRVISNLADANAKAANPANPANHGAIEALAHLGLTKLAEQ